MAATTYDHASDEAQGFDDARNGLPRVSTRAHYRRGYDRGISRPFPNLEPKHVGDYVRNVHPCGHDDEHGVVTASYSGADDPGEDGEVDVRTGIGGTTYGPARNWRVVDARPAWLDELADRQERGRSYVGRTDITLDGTPAAICGRLERFATVAALPNGPRFTYAWEAVARIVEMSGGAFRS